MLLVFDSAVLPHVSLDRQAVFHVITDFQDFVLIGVIASPNSDFTLVFAHTCHTTAHLQWASDLSGPGQLASDAPRRHLLNFCQ